VGALFVRRPIVAIVIAILTTMAGYVAMTKLPTAQYPDIVPPQIQVSTTYTGADAITIEQSVATPLEQQMNGVDYMIYMQSTNANDGTMTLKVTFDVETDINLDQVNTQNRVSQAQPNLPPDVNQFGLTVKKATSNPLLVVSLYSPKGTYDALFLGNYATINVNDAIYRVPGVGQIQNYGTADYAMRIWVKPDRLASLGLTALATVAFLNRDFYAFLARRRGLGFALASIPLHLLYFVCSGLGYAWASAGHALGYRAPARFGERPPSS